MKTYQAGIDVGSTTVKLVVLDENGQMIFGQYQRHLSHTQRALSDLLKQARAALGECALELRATGSGAINLAKALGIPFVQEVVAVAQALERVAPQVDVAIELGGEDAKIIYFKGGLEVCTIKTVLFPIPPHSEVITALTVAAVGATPQRLCRGKCMKHTAIYAY